MEIFISVDFGTTHISLMAAERLDDGKLKILGVETTEIKENTIKNGIIRQPSEISFHLGGLVKKMENRLGQKYTIKGIYVAQSGCSLRTIRTNIQHSFDHTTEITNNDLNLIARKLNFDQFGNKTILSVMQEEYVINNELIQNPIGKFTKDITCNYLVACGKKEIDYNLNRSFERTIFTSSNIYTELAPIAVAKAVMTDQDKEEGCAVINFGASTTLVAVYHGGYLRHTAVIPFGSDHITQDLCDINIPQKTAEKIKMDIIDMMIREKNNSILVKNTTSEKDNIKFAYTDLYNIAEARVAEITDFVIKEIEHSEYSNKLKRGLIITGGGAEITNLDKYLAEASGMNVRYGSHQQWLQAEPNTIQDLKSDSDSKIETPIDYSGYKYTLLIGLIANAKESCVELKDKEKPDAPMKGNQKSKNSSLLGAFKSFGDLFNKEETIEE